MTNEEKLLERAQNGDVRAFEELIGRHEKMLYNIALRTMKNHADAADMAQESILKLYRALPSFKGNCGFAVWAARVVVNTCLDELRRKARREQPTEEETLTAALVDESAEQAFARKELRERIALAIDSLDADYRVAITLRDIEGMSYMEIAQVTGLAMGTVKSRINRARKLLAKKLALYLHDA